MSKQYHILNGDALKEQFPKDILGEIIVTRECLIEGAVESNSLEEFYENRAEFICESYAGFSKDDYYKMTVCEFNKIKDIENNSTINLWFEDDLFCQVNFWFVLYLLNYKLNDCSVYLVRPLKGHEYSFGTMNKSQLATIFKERTELSKSEIDKMILLWHSYSKNDLDTLINNERI